MFIHEMTASFVLTILIYSISRGHVVSEPGRYFGNGKTQLSMWRISSKEGAVISQNAVQVSLPFCKEPDDRKNLQQLFFGNFY